MQLKKKKIYLILFSIVIIVMFVLLGMGVYAKYKTKQSYITYFERCQETMSERIDYEIQSIEFLFSESGRVDEEKAQFLETIQACVDENGCYVTCGSGCGLPEPDIGFIEAFLDFYMSFFKECPAVCTTGCIYPVK